MATATPVTAAQVRAWGREQNANGADFKGVDTNTRGRLNPVLIEAFNKSRKPNRRYAEGNKAPRTVAVKVPTGKGNRTRSVEVNVAEARTAAQAAGREVGARGRVPQDVLEAFATNTLSSPTG